MWARAEIIEIRNKILTPSKSNSKYDSTSHYRESIIIWYSMKLNWEINQLNLI